MLDDPRELYSRERGFDIEESFPLRPFWCPVERITSRIGKLMLIMVVQFVVLW